MFQLAVNMARLTNACCLACEALGIIPEMDREYLSKDETESSTSVVVDRTVPGKVITKGSTKSLWRQGI